VGSETIEVARLFFRLFFILFGPFSELLHKAETPFQPPDVGSGSWLATSARRQTD